jgi:AcrR family transcriptional regulator
MFSFVQATYQLRSIRATEDSMTKSSAAPDPEISKVVDLSTGKDRLVRVAMQMFAERGHDSVTVRDISKEAGVSVGLINHHFGSKEGLREAVDKRFLKQFEEVVSGRVDRGPLLARTKDEYGDWVEGWIDRHIDDWDLTKAYMRRAILEGSDWGAELFERFYQVVRTSVDRSDAKGDVREDVDRLWLPILIMYLELGTLLMEPFVDRVLGKSSFDRTLWRRRHQAYTDLIYRGIRPEKPSN